jgi:hypothetical protein
MLAQTITIDSACDPEIVRSSVAVAVLRSRLDAYLVRALARPFDWAEYNCCHFAAGWVRAVEGRDPLDNLPPLDGARSARRLLRWLGGLPAAVTQRLGRAPIEPAQCKMGDLVALPLQRLGKQRPGYTLGICCGESAALVPATVAVFLREGGGAIWWPTSDCSHAWAVRA